MKKFLSYFFVILCAVIVAVGLVGCGSGRKWVTPEFTIDSQSYTIEHVTNANGDFTFPIKSDALQIKHSNYEQGMFEHSWIIYNASREIVGWIEAGNGYDIDKKGNCKYGFSVDTENGVYGIHWANMTLILKSTDLSIFDNLTITTNYGSVSKEDEYTNPIEASKRYTYYDEENNIMVGCEGSSNFVCCTYKLNFDGVDVDKINSVKITITPSSADFLG